MKSRARGFEMASSWLRLYKVAILGIYCPMGLAEGEPICARWLVLRSFLSSQASPSSCVGSTENMAGLDMHQILLSIHRYLPLDGMWPVSHLDLHCRVWSHYSTRTQSSTWSPGCCFSKLPVADPFASDEHDLQTD